MDKVVGLGEIVITNNTDDTIKTFALASCVGVTAYSEQHHLAGMIHIVLPYRPESSDSNSSPSYYASTGIPLFIRRLLQKGCRKNDLKINIYGGANAAQQKDYFNIGKRNLAAVEAILERYGINYTLVDVGGRISRTLIMDVSSGSVKVNTLPIEF